MKVLIFGIVYYSLLGICYAIDYFHNEYDDMVENNGFTVGEFFGMTILTGLLWPLFIIAFALMDIKGER